MPPRRRRGSITAAVQALVDDLGGQATPAQAAHAAMAIQLAVTLDGGAGLAVAAVNRELRETLKAMDTGSGGADGDPRTSALVALLSAPLGHAEG